MKEKLEKKIVKSIISENKKAEKLPTEFLQAKIGKLKAERKLAEEKLIRLENERKMLFTKDEVDELVNKAKDRFYKLFLVLKKEMEKRKLIFNQKEIKEILKEAMK